MPYHGLKPTAEEAHPDERGKDYRNGGQHDAGHSQEQEVAVKKAEFRHRLPGYDQRRYFYF